MEQLSPLTARRIALAAQGFTDRAVAAPGRSALARVLARTGLLQIDSVNVISRSHYLPVYSRLGGYPREVLDRAVNRRPRLLFEYWAHEASLLPVATQPLLRHRMAAAADEAWGGMIQIQRDRPDLVAHVLAEVAARGPVTAAQLSAADERPREHWGWNWSAEKRALEWLFFTGAISSAGRDAAFARRYDLTERVLPADVLAAPTPSVADAHRELIRIAARSLGVATEPDLRDYFRIRPAASRTAVAELVEEGALLPVTVRGWTRPAYLDVAARRPRRVRARTLLSPFDSLIWFRPRTQALFGFRYRLEIYTPQAKRVHGYYVLPFLLDEALVGRVDVKADRQAGVLRVQAAWSETGAPSETPVALAAELRRLADWSALDDVVVAGRGDLAAALTAALATG